MFTRNAFYRSAAMAVAGVSLALAAPHAAAVPTLQLSLVYAGHTTANVDTTLTGTTADLSDSQFQTSTVRHYMDVYAKFSNAAADQDFRAAFFDITFGANLQPITKAGVAGTTANKWFGNNPSSPGAGVNTFASSGDGGTAGDLLGIAVNQTDPSVAAITLVGETGSELGYNASLGSKLGRVPFAFTGPISANTSIAINPLAGGGNFSYFINNATGSANGLSDFVTPASDPTGATGQSFVVTAAASPEPGTAAVLGIVGMSLGLRRRRRNA